MQIRVYYKDTDAGGIVYHANYINFCEIARSEYLFKNGANAFGINMGFVVTRIVADYKNPCYLGDILEIKTTITSLKKASLTLHQEIYRIKDIKENPINKLAFSAEISLAFLVDGKISKIDEKTLNLLSKINN